DRRFLMRTLILFLAVALCLFAVAAPADAHGYGYGYGIGYIGSYGADVQPVTVVDGFGNARLIFVPTNRALITPSYAAPFIAVDVFGRRFDHFEREAFREGFRRGRR